MLSTKTIKPNAGSRRPSKRVGRGNGSGNGTFSGRGMNGQNARSGGGVPDWFEGGQTPLFRRMPKLKGFSNARYTKHFNIVNISDIELLAADGVKKITKQELLDAHIIRKKTLPIKLLGNGELKTKCDIEVDAASVSAIAAVEKAGGKLTLLTSTTDTEVSIPAGKKVEEVKTPKKEEKKEVVAEAKVEKKAPVKKEAATKKDDLTKVEGIGPKIAETLIAGGVVTFADLAKTDGAKIAEMIADVRGNHTPDTWPAQAQMAADGKWDELKAWQDELDGGK